MASRGSPFCKLLGACICNWEWGKMGYRKGRGRQNGSVLIDKDLLASL